MIIYKSILIENKLRYAMNISELLRMTFILIINVTNNLIIN